MNFSTALRLNDVDDYIAPAQSCIKPVKLAPVDGRTTSITVGADGDYVGTNSDGHRYTLAKAKIDLNDCLACSGCITTAETILVSQHSVSTFLEVLEANKTNNAKYEICVALSPQSIVSISDAIFREKCDFDNLKTVFMNWQCTQSSFVPSDVENLKYFCTILLKSNGVKYVLDTTVSRDISLLKSAEEFVETWQTRSDCRSDGYPRIPILTGICPGWVCFAEKVNMKTTSPESGSQDESFLLKHLSRVRSPQQLLAGFLKRTASFGHRLYTVFVMPCYDKKLEASRSEFEIHSGDLVEKETDLVLGTNEFIKVLDTLALEFNSYAFPQYHTGATLNGDDCFPFNNVSMYRHPGSGSGGYAFSVMHYAAMAVYGIQLKSSILTDERIIFRNLGNSDLLEILLFESANICESVRSQNLTGRTPFRLGNFKQQPLFSFLVSNGFRNIQTVIQQFKRTYSKIQLASTHLNHQTFPFDYIEIMACPGGCLNGGAQMKPSTNPESTLSTYFSLQEKTMMSSEESQTLLNLVEQKLSDNFFLTTYRRVPKLNIINPAALKW